MRAIARRRAIAGFSAAVAAIAALTAVPLAVSASAIAVGDAAANPVSSAHAAPPVRTSALSTSGVHLRVAPTVSTTIDPAAPLTLEVEVENATAESISAGGLRVVRSAEAIDDAAELDAWLAQAPRSTPDANGTTETTEAEPHELEGIEVAAVASDALAPGAVDVVSITVPAETIADLAGAPVLGLGVELLVGDTLVASATDAYASRAAPATESLSVALTYPLTVPASAAGLLTAEDLATWTSPFGLLTRQLDAVAGRQVAVAVDPRIIASIRVLGSAAPGTAVAWLGRLADLPNEIFPLAYADADVAAQAQLGLAGLLTPTGFSDALDPENFTGADGAAEVSPEDAGGATSTPSPTPTPTPTAPVPGELPTTDALLSWPYTRSDIAWPADDTIAAGNLGFLGAAGLTTAILAPGNVAPVEQWSNAASNIDGSTAVVADSRITAPLREASAALTETAWRAAAGLLGAELAIGGAENVGAPLTLLATFDRGAGAQSSRVAATLDELAASPWIELAPLSDAIGAPPFERGLITEPESDQRLANIDRIIRADADVAAFSTVLDDPRVLAAPVRREALAMLDVAWLDDREAWDTAVGEWLLRQRNTLGAVSVVPSSPINVVSTETGVPTTILNGLPYPVTVVVDVDPSNGRLIVEDQATVTVDPESRSTVRVPVAAGIGNGEVTLTVTLTSLDGVPVGSPVMIPVNVQADWEGFGAAILGVVLVVFFGVGVWRNIRRLRRQRAAAAAAAAADADAAAAADAAVDEPVTSDAEVTAPSDDQVAAPSEQQTEQPAEPGDERRDG
ncbi:hypothetical protein DCE93_14295 [Agromyces badenianii]|uniref:2-oxoglutarate dehydrogenase n=1 Tax=Agromyces badenianii TaxID=2080742 RepID=A0A2S0WZG9_9MICO|nr:hypothetical protein DCE93_14295 [Agromyces badenianii]